VSTCRTTFGGKQLVDGKTLRQYGLGPDMTVVLVGRAWLLATFPTNGARGQSIASTVAKDP